MANHRFTVSMEVENVGPHSDDKKITFSDLISQYFLRLTEWENLSYAGLFAYAPPR